VNSYCCLRLTARPRRRCPLTEPALVTPPWLAPASPGAAPPISRAGARNGNSTRSAQPGPGTKRLVSNSLRHARIAFWVREGGPSVTPEKVFSPISWLLDQVWSSIPLVDGLPVYVNSSAVDPLVPVFTLTIGSMSLHRDPPEHGRL